MVNSYIDGNYQYKKKDIPYLISTPSGEKSETEFVNVGNKDQFDINFPPLKSKPKKVFAKKKYSKKEIMPSECLLSMDEIKNIKEKDLTEEQENSLDPVNLLNNVTVTKDGF